MGVERFCTLGLAMICGSLGLACCARPDWRADEIAKAEAKMRGEISDPNAEFSRVQLTGDDKTGQTCGYVSARFGADGLNHVARFIVYIDTVAPSVEGGLGKLPFAQENFDRAWQSDCVKEGYAS